MGWGFYTVGRHWYDLTGKRLRENSGGSERITGDERRRRSKRGTFGGGDSLEIGRRKRSRAQFLGCNRLRPGKNAKTGGGPWGVHKKDVEIAGKHKVVRATGKIEETVIAPGGNFFIQKVYPIHSRTFDQEGATTLFTRAALPILRKISQEGDLLSGGKNVSPARIFLSPSPSRGVKMTNLEVDRPPHEGGKEKNQCVRSKGGDYTV